MRRSTVRPAEEYLELFLQPGEFHFTTDPDIRIRTLLGSCVAMTMWHPELRYGAMSHYLLPSRGSRIDPPLDGRFGDEAYLLFLNEALRHGTDPAAYEIKIFGGGDMFPMMHNKPAIGAQNVQACFQVLREHPHGPVKAQDVGGDGHRIVMFDVWDGGAWVKHRRLVGAAPRQRTARVCE
jgi:chemotaxis protein CheD